MPNNELRLPTDALALPDDTETLVAPEVGDTVTVTIEGKVTRSEGGNVYLQPTSANGKPIESAEPPGEMSMEDEGAALEKMAVEGMGGGF